MTNVYFPETTNDVSEIIGDNIISGQKVEVRTNGSLINLGQKMATDSILSLKKFDQITSYEPEELVITLGPGVKLSELVNMLAKYNQELRFEPPDYGPLFGNQKDMGSIGGIIGCNLSGPKRFLGGGARDFILGVEGVSGYGKTFKSGGKVVKNVTGYDISKLMAGSYGTLGALTEFTLKLSPIPEAEISFLVHGLNDKQAIQLMSRIAMSPIETSGLAHLPMNIAKTISQGSATTILRLEGASVSIKERSDAILKLINKYSFSLRETEESKFIWSVICNVAPTHPPADKPLWKICVPATYAPDLINHHKPDFYYFDWAGGLIWMASDEIPKIENGAYWLIRTPEGDPSIYPFTNIKDAATNMIMTKVKKAFDPKNILNPRRLGG